MAANRPNETLTSLSFAQMSMAERKAMARAHGVRVADIESELQLNDALVVSSNIAFLPSHKNDASITDVEPLCSQVERSFELRERDRDETSTVTVERDHIKESCSALNQSIDIGVTCYANLVEYDLTNTDTGHPLKSFNEGGQGDRLCDKVSHSNKKEDSPDEDQISTLFLALLVHELQRLMMAFLDGDSLGQFLVTQRNPVLRSDDSLFRTLCEHTYLRQSRHKVVDPSKWGGWRRMWLYRPRVRTNGFYCMATEWLRPAVHDMWGGVDTSVHTLKCQTFRYFRFFDDGGVLYCLTHRPPERMAKHLASKAAAAATTAAALQNPIREGKEPPPVVTKGTFSMHQDSVFVAVRSHFNVVKFTLKLTHGYRGHFARLKIIRHTSYANAAAPGSDPVYHPETVGYSYFFWRSYPGLL